MAEPTKYRTLTDEQWWAIVAPKCGISSIPPLLKAAALVEDDPEPEDSSAGLEVPAVDSQQ